MLKLLLICAFVAGSSEQVVQKVVQPVAQPVRSCLAEQKSHRAIGVQKSVTNKDLTDALLKYTLSQYQHMSRNTEYNDLNLFTSPYSMWMALTLTYLGARGETSKVLGELLKISHLDKEEVEKQLFQLKNDITGGGEVFTSANMLAFDKRVQLKGCLKYVSLLDITSSDFEYNPMVALSKLNRFVSRKTNGKIPEALSKEAITSETLLVLLNAVYFKGTWKYNFNPRTTIKDFFIVSPQEVREVQMMKIQTLFGYYHSMEYNFSAVEMPYTGDKYSMLLVMPDDRNTDINNFIAQMIPEDITGITSGLRERSMTLHVPKIRIDADYNMNSLLTDMGAGSIFNGASLDGFIQSSPPMSVSDVVHKSFLDIDEKGTEAAASSAIVTQTRTGGKFGHIVLKFNRPHLFMIRDIENDVILFMGVIRKPQGTAYKISS